MPASGLWSPDPPEQLLITLWTTLLECLLLLYDHSYARFLPIQRNNGLLVVKRESWTPVDLAPAVVIRQSFLNLLIALDETL